ncbi:MAG TPA: sigma-54 dependent transcriptional regulator [Candidatus Binatia bacterium]|jgi:DNA-binding NtrC family response regulator|nr:sigma-54 dependent transcriptional regulator [Candidatus Binatia bacterium]
MSVVKSNADVRILYVEDDLASGRLVQSIAETVGYAVDVVTTGSEFLSSLTTTKPDLLLVDLHLPDASGLELLAKARLRLPESPIIVVTASNAIEDAVKALKGGATDYLTKPVDHQRLIVSLTNAVKMARQHQDLNKLRTEIRYTYKLEHVIGTSSAMEQVRDMIRHAAQTDATVLISGESGTGKELVAKALHYASRRAAKPFVDVNCAAMTETLIESELFGHEKGSFTSAFARRRGKFEQAHGGSFFLDEIGDMPLVTQAKMLRVLQERSFQRVGGEEKINVDVRVICATNQNLENCVEAGTFRLDLFYRINPLMIEVPPLRERPSDIPELVNHFLNAASQVGNTHVRSVSDEARIALQQHSWPGNVRELQNAIERAYTVCHEDEIQLSHLPAAVLRRAPVPRPPSGSETSDNRNLVEKTEQYERSIIMAELAKCEWNKTKAALALGVTRRILSYKMQTLGIDKPVPIVYNS